MFGKNFVQFGIMEKGKYSYKNNKIETKNIM